MAIHCDGLANPEKKLLRSRLFSQTVFLVPKTNTVSYKQEQHTQHTYIHTHTTTTKNKKENIYIMCVCVCSHAPHISYLYIVGGSSAGKLPAHTPISYIIRVFHIIISLSLYIEIHTHINNGGMINTIMLLAFYYCFPSSFFLIALRLKISGIIPGWFC